MQQTEWVSETADVDCSWWTVCIKSTERLFWVNKRRSDSKHFLYDWIPLEWRASAYRDINELNKCCSFSSPFSFNHGLSTRFPRLFQSSMICVCLCVFVCLCVWSERINHPLPSSYFPVCLQVWAPEFKPGFKAQTLFYFFQTYSVKEVPVTQISEKKKKVGTLRKKRPKKIQNLSQKRSVALILVRRV